MKGQVAFETIFILLVIITATIFITSFYTVTNDVTIAESITRNEINEQAILQNQKIVITSLVYQNSPDTNITINILAENPSSLDFNKAKIVSKIRYLTKITDIEIVTNIKQL